MIKSKTVGFVGMTHLGLVSSICAAEKGLNIICYDINPSVINQMNACNFGIEEPSLLKLYKKNKTKIFFTSNINDLIDLDIIYISPDIPTNDKGKSDLTFITNYLLKLSTIDKRGKIHVILSQVPPGFTRKFTKKFYNLYYQVETLIFGDAVNRSLYPERFIIGSCDSDKALHKKFKFLLELYNCPIINMKYESAELAKISINMFLVSSVSTANTIAELCEKIGANYSEIIPALRKDKRIGDYAYINPGLGISGGNLERDLSTFIDYSKNYESDYRVVSSWKANSQHRKKFPIKILESYKFINKKNLIITIFGLSYKINTHSTKNSPTINLLKFLKNYKNIHIYDPIIKSIKVGNIEYVSKREILQDEKLGDIVVIMNNSSMFKKVNSLTDLKNVKLIIDPFKVITNKTITNSRKYFTLGQH